MVLIGLALTAIIYPLIQGRADGWPAWTFVSLGAGAALLGAFALWERRRGGDPLIEPGLLANRTYTSGILVALAFFGAFGGLVLCVSLFAQLGEHFSPIHAGLTLIAMVVGMIAGMGAGFALVGRLGRHLLHLGVAIVAAGTVVLALTVTGARTASTLDLAPGLSLIGLGAGASLGQLFDFILAGVGMDEVGSGSGVLEAVQQLSSALGVAAPGNDLLLGVRRESPDARPGHHGVGLPGAAGRYLPARVQTADALPSPHRPDGGGERSAAPAGAEGDEPSRSGCAEDPPPALSDWKSLGHPIRANWAIQSEPNSQIKWGRLRGRTIGVPVVDW